MEINQKISNKKNIYGIILLYLILFAPYYPFIFRIDQLLIPFVTIFLLIFKKINKNVLKVFYILFFITTIIPLISTFFILGDQSFINLTDFIRTITNLIKFPIYFLFGAYLYSYFYVPERKIVKFIKVSLVVIMLITILAFMFRAFLGVNNFFDNFLVEFYNLLSKNKYSFRFPTIFAQPFTVGVFFIFFSFYIVINDKFFSNKWFIIISLIAFFSNSKVFWFSLPFIFLIIIIHKYNFLKRIKINNNLLKISFFLLITLLFIISFIYFFGEEINNLTGYIFTVMLNNPLAGRADNFVMNGILWNLHNRTFLGNGFTYNSLNINHFGTWDSSFYFYINFGGVIYVFLIYTILYWLLFKSFIIKKYRSIIIFIFFLNIFLSGIGTTTLNQERASDLFFILIGYYYLKRREEIN